MTPPHMKNAGSGMPISMRFMPASSSVTARIPRPTGGGRCPPRPPRRGSGRQLPGGHSASAGHAYCRGLPSLSGCPSTCARHGQAGPGVAGDFPDVGHTFTPVVEPVSIDEGLSGFDGLERLLGPPEDIGREIKRRILKARAAGLGRYRSEPPHRKACLRTRQT